MWGLSDTQERVVIGCVVAFVLFVFLCAYHLNAVYSADEIGWSRGVCDATCRGESTVIENGEVPTLGIGRYKLPVCSCSTEWRGGRAPRDGE